MDKFEKLVNQIMAEAEADGEPVTREEAEEMAKMELGAKEIKNYTQSDKTKKERKPREKKVDTEKADILNWLVRGLYEVGGISCTTENENKLHFVYNENSYTVNLVRHRPPKK